MHFILREIKLFENIKMIYKINAQTPKVSCKDQNLSDRCRIIYKKEVKNTKVLCTKIPCTLYRVRCLVVLCLQFMDSWGKSFGAWHLLRVLVGSSAREGLPARRSTAGARAARKHLPPALILMSPGNLPCQNPFYWQIGGF